MYAWIICHSVLRSLTSCPVIKTINLPKDSKNEQVGQFWLAYQTWLVGEMTITFELLKVSKMISLKIYISPVKEKLETPNLNSR